MSAWVSRLLRRVNKVVVVVGPQQIPKLQFLQMRRRGEDSQSFVNEDRGLQVQLGQSVPRNAGGKELLELSSERDLASLAIFPSNARELSSVLEELINDPGSNVYAEVSMKSKGFQPSGF